MLRKILEIVLLNVMVSATYAQTVEKPNILFFILDDLNDYLDVYEGHPQVSTPNISLINATGTTFSNAFSSAPGCAPSRTSFLSGKDVDYTQVYSNVDYEYFFRDNFNEGEKNQEVYTLPQILKDSGGYYTYAINKVFHNREENDFDYLTSEECDKNKSWNKLTFFEDDTANAGVFAEYSFGNYFDFGPLPDSFETYLEDYKAASTAIEFINDFADSAVFSCNNPFFMAVGFHKPHNNRFIPEKYFHEYYLNDIYAEPFDYPYNYPIGSYPVNGLVMPPQPDTLWADYYALPDSGIAQGLVEVGKFMNQVDDFIESLPYLPEIDPSLTYAEREFVLLQTAWANYVSAYIAAVQYIDAQIGRVLVALESHPTLKENTIIIFVSDHGYSLGEKYHWTKWGLWETDIRVPLMISVPGKPGGMISGSVVSMLDLFPTVCDLAGVSYPLFSTGEKYLDGNSLVSLLDTPNLSYDYAAISTTKKGYSAGGCFPYYSIRNDRFHYISYRLNNDGTLPFGDCDSTGNYYEEELYEVGANREIDPNEWNNLIEDEDYKPVIEYLQQWMPDSNLYLQKTYKAIIDNNELNCFLNYNDTIELSFQLYNPHGVLIFPPAGYEYLWTNNLTDDELSGPDINFNMNVLSDDQYASSSRIIIYLRMVDTATGTVVAFDGKYFYLNDANIPSASFSVNIDSVFTACVSDYSITGSYINTWWDFGDGSILYENTPGPHTYPIGDYTITHYVQYGNDSCVLSFTQNVYVNTGLLAEVDLLCYPNPASSVLHISLPVQLHNAILEVYDLFGRKVYSKSYINQQGFFSCSLNVSHFAPGSYTFVIKDTEASYKAPLIVAH